MSNLTLNEIDKSVYETVRLALVANGMLPDVRNYTTPESYNQAKVTLGGDLVEVLGVGAAEAKGDKSGVKILIERKGFSAGDLGNINSKEFVKKDSGSFKAISVTSMSTNIDYDIRVLSSSVKMERKCLDVLIHCFGMRRYIPVVDSEEVVLINFKGDVDVSSVGNRERLVKYTVMDIWLNESLGGEGVIKDDVAPLSSLNFEIVVSGISGTKETGEKVSF